MKQGHDELKKLITEFKNKFYPYKNIKRFSIPVIGCISSGKSTILNYLLKLKKTLQMADKITTKCVCIIRHKKGCKKAKIYNVNIKERGDYIYNFEKGDEIVSNVAQVIEKKNKDIEEKKVGYDYKKYFLIIEYEIPFFIGNFEKYAEFFEFMDIPGLNETVEISNNNEKNSIDENFYFKQIFPLIQNNIKFSLFIFAADTYDKENSLQILKTYINGGSKKNKKEKDNEFSNYENNKNEEIKKKAELEKEQQKLFCYNKTFKESIFILNKIDKFKDEKEEGKKNFRDFISKNFEINLNDNNQPCIIGSKLNNEILKLESFRDYINYYILNSDENNRINNFYNYISEIMNKDFEINIKIKNKESDEENEEEEENEDEEKKEEDKIPSFMEKEEFENFKQLKNIANKKSYILNFMKVKQYYNLSKIFKKYKSNYKIKKEENEGLEEMIKSKMKNIIEDYYNIGKYEGMIPKIISDFNIDTSKKNLQQIKLRLDNLIKNKEGIGDPNNLIKDFYKYIVKLEQLQKNKKSDNKNFNNETISKLKNKYNEIKNYFNNTSAIRFLLVGPHNSGKSSILNDIIGYNQKFLQTGLKETTKTGIIIKYIKKGETPKLFDTNFITNESGYNYFEYNKDHPIAEGEISINSKIIFLNNEYSNNSEFKFYLLESPIEFLDKTELNEEEKKKIELIDYPGLDTNFEKAKIMAENLLKIVDGFIYVFFETSFDDANQNVLIRMYNILKNRINFSFNTCLFILNKIDSINEDINYKDINNRILKIFDDQNGRLSSREVLKQKQRIGDEYISLSGFSSQNYNKYKELEKNILNFEKFIEINSPKEKEEKEGFFKKIGNIFSFSDKIQILENNLRKNYLEKIYIKNFSPDPIIFKNRLKDLKNLFRGQNVDNKKLEKIVNLYLYILENRTNIKEYELSKIGNLLKNLNQVIKNSFIFFKEKIQFEAVDFITFCFLQIIELLNITKIKVNNENISAFKEINKDEIINKINSRKFLHQEEINNEFEYLKETFENNISNCSNSKSSFESMLKENNTIFDESINNIIKICNNFDNFLKKEYHKYLGKLNLKEMEESKQEFENNINNFKKTKIKNSSRDASSYISHDTVTTRLWYTFWISKNTKEVYDHKKTIKKYRKDINNNIFLKGKKDIKNRIKINTNNTINNINEILRKFNDEVACFKDNFIEFQKIVEEIEKFIYKNLGITG